MNADHSLFLKSGTSSAVGFSRLAAQASETEGLSISWTAVGTPSIAAEHGAEYYGSYSGFLILTEGQPVAPRLEVDCPGFHGHEYSQEGICRCIDPNGNQYLVKWECTPTAPPEGALAACEGVAHLIGAPDSNISLSVHSDFYAVIKSQNSDGSLIGHSRFGRDLFDSDNLLARQLSTAH